MYLINLKPLKNCALAVFFHPNRLNYLDPGSRPLAAGLSGMTIKGIVSLCCHSGMLKAGIQGL